MYIAGEALHALESELGRLEAGPCEQGGGHRALAGHAAVERALPRPLLVALEGAAGERAREAEGGGRLLGGKAEQPGAPAAPPRVPYTEGT